MEEQTKRCSECGKIKSISEFSKHKNRKGGLHPQCKVCNAIYYQENKEEIAVRKAVHYEEHREELLVKQAIYHRENKEEELARSARYDEEHKEEKVVYNALYYVEHKEEIATSNAAWAKANPDKHRAASHRRRAKKKGNGGTHTAEDVQQQGDMQRWMCWWGGPGCAGYCKDKYDVDHIVPLDKGGHNDPSNIVISCPRCNRSKQDKLPEDWIGRLF